MGSLNSFLSILAIGAAGAIVYTVLTHPEGVRALTDGADKLLVSSYGASLGKVA